MSKKYKKRANGAGSSVFLGNGRHYPYVARLMIGKDSEGKPIYFDIDKFETELDALVCLENWLKNPTPLKIKTNKYNRIVTFSHFPKTRKPYPLVPVDTVEAAINRKNKKYYTFKQVYDEMKKVQFPTKEEKALEKKLHIRTDGKLSCSHANQLTVAFNHCQSLYNKIYRELRTSDFNECINNPEIKPSIKTCLIKLFKNMDKYAYSEDIIDKKFTIDLKSSTTTKQHRTPFSYEEINYLWKIQENNSDLQFVRDFLLLAIYTGGRAEELLFTYTNNIFLTENYFVTGLKTEAGQNRVIPIHKKIKPIIQKYYNPKNTFLFMSQKVRMRYAQYLSLYNKFISKYPNLKGKTAHCGRHSLETELQKLNIKTTIINAIIGHKNGNVADDVYNHISLQEKIEAINMVDYQERKIYILNSTPTNAEKAL